MDSRLGSDEWMAEKKQRASERANHPLTPWPALNEVLDMELDHKRFAALALPWEPGGETPFHIAQAAAKAGASPLCLFPSWSPHWDGTLNVHRSDALPETVDYRAFLRRPGASRMLIVDSFSRLYWESVATHESREDVVRRAGRDLLELALSAGIPILVILRRRKGTDLTLHALKSDGALEYDADVMAMVEPDFRTGTAVMNVVKNRTGPTCVSTVEWEALPRTLYRRLEEQ